VSETRHHRFEAFFDLLLAGGGDPREGAAVKRIDRRQDFEAAFAMAELARQFEQAFIDFDAAVAKETFARANELDQRAGQFTLTFMVIKIGAMGEFGGLLGEDLGDRRVRMAEAVDGNAAAHIQITFAGDIEHIAARAVAEHDVEAAVTRHDVLEQPLNGGDIVAHDGWRRWQNFFHGRVT
jgi:hypothetical protein